jgi:ribonuclease HI
MMQAQPYYREITLYADASANPNPGPSSIAYAIYDRATGNLLEQGGFFIGYNTIVRAEYAAIAVGLEVSSKYCCKKVNVISDNQTAIRQLQHSFRIHETKLDPYFLKCQQLEAHFSEVLYFLLKSDGAPLDKSRHRKVDSATKRINKIQQPRLALSLILSLTGRQAVPSRVSNSLAPPPKIF